MPLRCGDTATRPASEYLEMSGMAGCMVGKTAPILRLDVHHPSRVRESDDGLGSTRLRRLHCSVPDIGFCD
ncbi:MAG: hypothetical protein ACRECH_00085 [Nitrososphaerales archaeon]